MTGDKQLDMKGTHLIHKHTEFCKTYLQNQLCRNIQLALRQLKNSTQVILHGSPFYGPVPSTDRSEAKMVNGQEPQQFVDLMASNAYADNLG